MNTSYNVKDGRYIKDHQTNSPILQVRKLSSKNTLTFLELQEIS